MLGALDPRVTAILPTGSGGLWTLVILTATIEDGLDIGTVIGPLLGTAVVLAVFLAAWRRQRSVSPVPPLLAAALCAAAPAAVHASAAARLDDGTWLALIAAVQLAVAPRAFAVGEATDRIVEMRDVGGKMAAVGILEVSVHLEPAIVSFGVI